MSRRRRVALALLIVLAALLLALVILVPRFVNLDAYRPEITARAEQQLGRPVEIGPLKLSLLPGLEVRADGFAVGNPVGFPPGDLMRAERVEVDLDAGALWHRRILIKSLTLERPVFRLLANSTGRWNFENPAPASAGVLKTAGHPERPSSTLGIISTVKLDDGEVTFARVSASGSVSPPSVDIRGVSTEFQRVDLSRLGSSPASSLPAGAWTTQAVAWSGEPAAAPLAATGTFQAQSLRVGVLEAAHLKSQVEVENRRIRFRNLDFDFCSGHGTGDFAVDWGGSSLRYTADLQFRNVDMASLLAAFPGARGKMTGKLSGALSLTGEASRSTEPLAGQQGRGVVTVRDGRLPTLELNKNLLQLANWIRGAPLRGDPSSFSSLSADLEIGGGRISSRHVVLSGPVVNIDAHGSLTLAGAGELNYEGTADIAAQQNAFTSILGGLLGQKVTAGKLSFPFGLEGTVAHPRFVLKSPAALRRLPGFEPGP
jgi:uncharacterized protein involved in outer membrane biogenesis